MEKSIREATGIITGDTSGKEAELLTELTNCAVRIATIALTALRDELRDKALNVAKSIADYEDELTRQL